jgi:hypothetical protein
MKWLTHKRIVHRILQINNFDEHCIKNAEEGSIYPDKHLSDGKDHRFNNNGLTKIRLHIQKARSLVLKNNSLKAFYEYGIATHYVTDGVTAVHMFDIPGDDKKHINYERQLEELDVAAGTQLLKDAIKDNTFLIKGPADLKKMTKHMSDMRKNSKSILRNKKGIPSDDLYLAYYFNYNMLKSIFVSPHLPEDYSLIAKKKVLSIKKNIILKLYALITITISLYIMSMSILVGTIIAAILLSFKWGDLSLLLSLMRNKEIYGYFGRKNKFYLTSSINKGWYTIPSRMYTDS